MITEAELAHWRTRVPWIPDSQVEQDLVLSRLIVEFARDPLLGGELVFRGGTCFHKLWLDRPWRYSEDLDYVRRTDGGIGDIFDAIRSIAANLGFERITTQVGRHPKVKLRSTLVAGGPLQVKVEMNTFERSPARPTVTRSFAVASPWFTGDAKVPTFSIEELTATKVRALFQRRKGRDLFDLWLAVHHGEAVIDDIVACFEPYRPEGWSVERALDNLDAKLVVDDFTNDLDQLVDAAPNGYSIDAAATTARQVIRAVG